MPLILGTNSIKDTGYNVDNSLRFNRGSTDNLSRTFGTATSQKTFTWSFWYKKTKTATDMYFFENTGGSTTQGSIAFGSDDKLFLFDQTNGALVYSSLLLRDTSAWYHIVIRVDTTQSTATDRIRMYFNGVQNTLTGTQPSQNTDLPLVSSSGSEGTIGKYDNTNSNLDGYLCEVVFCDGQSLAPTSFGEFDEDSPTIWKPKDGLADDLTFGNNGFYLDFENSGSLGADVSGNGNNFTVNNLTAVDQSTDTCTNNFATLNRLAWTTGTGLTFSEGNLKVANSVSDWRPVISTIPVTTGKWYCEIKCTAIGSGAQYGVTPITDYNDPGNLAFNIGDQARTFVYINDGNKENNGSAASYGNTYTTNDIIGIAIDLTNNYIYFSKNGNFQASGDPTSGSSGTNAAYALTDGYYYGFTFATNAGTAEINFGSPSFSISSGNTDGNGYGNFEYAVPSGYYSLCTKNLAEYG